MESIIVMTSYLYAPADIKAQLTEEGRVKMWFYYKDIDQERHEIILTPEECDRFVAWIEWQRKEAVLQKKQAVPAEEDK